MTWRVAWAKKSTMRAYRMRSIARQPSDDRARENHGVSFQEAPLHMRGMEGLLCIRQGLEGVRDKGSSDLREPEHRAGRPADERALWQAVILG